MDFNTLYNKVMGMTKGAFTAMSWEKELPVKSAYKSAYKVTKVSSGIVRFGCEYDNLGAVQTKRETGELPRENAGLPWGVWNVYPYFIAHKGANYVRCSLMKNSNIKSSYYINGQLATKEQAEQICTKSAFGSGNIPDILTINTNNIKTIG